MVYLSTLLEQLGVNSCLCSPSDLLWVDGRAQVTVTQPPSLLMRSFVSSRRNGFLTSAEIQGGPIFLRGGKTPVSNPAFDMISQSKRFPIVWDQLQASCQPGGSSFR